MARADDTFRADLSWEEKAQLNPLYAVMAVSPFKDLSADPADWSEEDLKAFFDKGQVLYDINIRPVLRRMNAPKAGGLVVEYGSGMGRLLKALVTDGYACAGIDISPTMLALSARLVPEARRLYGLNEDGQSDLPSACADFVFSYAVIQHIDSLSGVRAALGEICRLCKPGGRIRFQIVSRELPFAVPGRSTEVRVENRELDSVVTTTVPPTANDEAASTGSKTVTHTRWHGVPLSIVTMGSILMDHGVLVTGVAEDARSPRVYWIDGRRPCPGDAWSA